jgi:hypothetical protein
MDDRPTAIQTGGGWAIRGDSPWAKGREDLAHFQTLFAYFLT